MMKMKLIIPYMNAIPTSPATVQYSVKLPVIENSYWKSEVWSCFITYYLLHVHEADLKGKYNTYSGCSSEKVKEGMSV